MRPLLNASLSALLLAGAVRLVSATPYPKDSLHDAGYSYLRLRGCESYCGSDNQYCCAAGQSCTTLEGDIATCVGGGGGGGEYPDYTTTWTETFTSTAYTSWVPAPTPTAGVDCIPKNADQEACGTICCAGWQTCAFAGQCSSKPGYQAPSTVVYTTNGQVTTQYSAPYRVIGTTTITAISTGARSSFSGSTATSTSTGTAAGETIGAGSGGGGGSSSLSGGAIAGIVIGVLAGVALLILLCFCCIVRGLWNAIFGGSRRKKERERVDVVEEEYRHGSRVPSQRRERHSGWFGGRPASDIDRREKKKSSGGLGWLGLAGLAATMLALLNLRGNKKKPPPKPARSRYSNSYYSYSDYTRSGGKQTPTYQSDQSNETC